MVLGCVHAYHFIGLLSFVRSVNHHMCDMMLSHTLVLLSKLVILWICVYLDPAFTLKHNLAALGVLDLDVYRRCRTVLHKVLCIVKRHLMQTYVSEWRFCYRFARLPVEKLCKVHIFKQELTDCNGPFFPWAH